MTISDIEQIRRTIVLYAMLADDMRFEEWCDLFTEDAEFIITPGIYPQSDISPPAYAKGRAQLLAMVQNAGQRWKDNVRKVLHLCAPPLIDIHGETANAWWDFAVFHMDANGIAVKHAGRYYAELVKQGSVWRFKKRVSVRSGGLVPSNVAPMPSH